MEHNIFIIFLLLVCAALYVRTRVLEERLAALDIALKTERAEQAAKNRTLELATSNESRRKAGF